VLSHVQEGYIRGQITTNQQLRGHGEKGLASGCGREETSHAVERWSNVIPIAYLNCPGVQGHTHLNGSNLLRPGLGSYSSLSLESGVKGMGSGGEDGTESVPFCAKDMAPTLFNSLPENSIMALDGRFHSLGVVLPTRGGAFYIRE
jgi:hypothetical protein